MVTAEAKKSMEIVMAVDIIRKRGGKWRRRTPRTEKIVNAEEVIREIQTQPWYAVSFNKQVTRVIINLVNVYGTAYEQIIFEYI